MKGIFTNVMAFFKPPEYESFEQTQKARFLHISLFVVTGVCLITGILNLGIPSHLDIFLFLVAGISIACVPLNKHHLYWPVAIVLSLLVLGVITYSQLGVGLVDAGLIAYPVFIIFTSYLLNKKAAWLAVALSIASIALIYSLDEMGYLTPVHYSNENRLIVISVLLLSAGFFLWMIVDHWEQMLQEIKDTYDLTLMGWGKALDYRDQETQGHCQRVVTMTLDLAKQLGIPESQAAHIRRGALLHDIGKMAIPDAILLKQGRLTEEERDVMARHPIYARNLLESIPYLKPAIDIPYFHHERWDGTGYPEGLSGEAIPIAARIFALVDVWDALTTDRPYHQAWTHEKTKDYIREQAGKMFDPRVVDVFLQYVEDNKHF